ncbi:uncharacterized protein BJX67DRAFT_75853 [Aspergillus lucknowensis]|uniref:Uncharacterized protein n=1 Tax=Aspergillus lucknowensis TaxID=176173 RepID=A0ABR4LW98_9EURO
MFRNGNRSTPRFMETGGLIPQAPLIFFSCPDSCQGLNGAIESKFKGGSGCSHQEILSLSCVDSPPYQLLKANPHQSSPTTMRNAGLICAKELGSSTSPQTLLASASGVDSFHCE